MTVYACPTCDARALGEQYCHDCNTFMHGIGIGGTCPPVPSTSPSTNSQPRPER